MTDKKTQYSLEDIENMMDSLREHDDAQINNERYLSLAKIENSLYILNLIKLYENDFVSEFYLEDEIRKLTGIKLVGDEIFGDENE